MYSLTGWREFTENRKMLIAVWLEAENLPEQMATLPHRYNSNFSIYVQLILLSCSSFIN